MPPLKGIFHAAAVLDDGPIYTIREQQLESVMRPKALGAWHLHRLTAGLKLDAFVLISSIASLIGSPGQATYVVANTFLDALAHHRRLQGLPAMALNLGALSEVGMAARHEGVERHLSRVGVGSLTPAQALDMLGRILLWDPVQTAAAKMDWGLWGGVYPAWAASPRYRHLMPSETDLATGRRICARAGCGSSAARSGRRRSPRPWLGWWRRSCACRPRRSIRLSPPRTWASTQG